MIKKEHNIAIQIYNFLFLPRIKLFKQTITEMTSIPTNLDLGDNVLKHMTFLSFDAKFNPLWIKISEKV